MWSHWQCRSVGRMFVILKIHILFPNKSKLGTFIVNRKLFGWCASFEMAPRELLKAKPKTQSTVSTIAKQGTTRKPVVPTTTTTKKTIPVKKPTDIATPARETRQRVNTVPAAVTPKPKDNRSVPLPSSVSKSAKKSWQRRPKPAHSGVPVPEKMKRLLMKELQNCKF